MLIVKAPSLPSETTLVPLAARRHAYAKKTALHKHRVERAPLGAPVGAVELRRAAQRPPVDRRRPLVEVIRGEQEAA
jgi:hypothetical protein